MEFAFSFVDLPDELLQLVVRELSEIAGEGCAGFAAALRGGALPALTRLELAENPASEEAQEAVSAALSARN